MNNPFKPGSISATVFGRLLDGREHRMMDLFQGLPVADPSRTLAHMRKLGAECGQWTITRVPGKPGTFRLIF